MIIIFCDGSTKYKQHFIVTSLIVCDLETYTNKQQNIITRIKSVLYVSKQRYSINEIDNNHELLAIKDAFVAIKSLNIQDEVLIINDSVEMIKLLQHFKINKEWLGKDSQNIHMENINELWTSNIQIQWGSRNTLGINIADFLNKEIDSWTNEKDTPYLKTQMNRLLKKDYVYKL
jgi:hypothetical protein